MSAEPITEILELERLFNAPVERVFDAWTQAGLLIQWFGPDGFRVVEAEADCKPGGKYNIALQSPDGTTIEHFGEYLVVDRPNKLIFTWMLENQACQGSAGQTAATVVELRFVEKEAKTLLFLKHEKLPDRTALEGHRFGWQSSFECLDKLLSQ